MRTLLQYIDTVFLSRMSLRAQLVWLRSFISLLESQAKIVESKYQLEEIHARLESGEIENPAGYTAEEIDEAVRSMRKSRPWISKVGYELDNTVSWKVAGRPLFRDPRED